MVLRICTLLFLVAVATAQSNVSSTMSSSVPAVTASSTPQPTPVTQPPPVTPGYDSDLAIAFRNRHFYCLDVNETDFPARTSSGTADNADLIQYYWAVFLQYPVLSYLDSQRKAFLLYILASLAASGGRGTELANFNESDFCIADVYHYRVSEYDESVLVNFYFTGDIVNNTVTIPEFDAAFRSGYSGEQRLVQNLFGRRALAVDVVLEQDFEHLNMSETESNQHPGSGNDPGSDPTLRAILIGSYVGYTNVDRALAERQEDFLGNPNPINFNLEPGDIVFSIFGAIFLTVVMGLVLLGFCIHPFFLA